MLDKLKKIIGEIRQIRWDIFHIERNIVKDSFHWSFSGGGIKGSYVFVCDGVMNHGGFFDRMKGIMSIYALSKVRHRRFIIYFVHPFNLEEYLVPNRYAWNSKDISFDYPYSKPVVGYFEFLYPWRIMMNRIGEVHYYFGYNILDRINARYNANFDWSALYHELFKPAPFLQKEISALKSKFGSNYLSVHVRFLNLLGDDNENESRYKTLPEEERNKLIIKVKNTTIGLHKKYNIPLLLSTDSNVFLDAMRNENFILTVPGVSRHIDNEEQESQQKNRENTKLFLDYYMLAEGQQVISIIGCGLYQSDFPKYSAIIGGKPFRRINLE